MKFRRTMIIAALVVAATSVVAAAALATTSIKPYAVPVGDEYSVTPLFSVDDKAPVLGGAGMYRMVGIPDGLGAHGNGNGTSTLYMNHELGFTALSEPYVGGVKNRGAFVSKWTLDANGNPTAGKRAYDKVYLEDTLVGDAATTANSTRAFARFCSGSLAGPEHGFDRYITSRTKRAVPRRSTASRRAGSRSRSSTTTARARPTVCQTSGVSPGRTRSSRRARAT